MGASLGPVLANIIMSELELKIVDDLLHSGIIKFYARYVDDTLIMVKSEHIETILTKFNSFHKSLKLTVDKFEHETPHFLEYRYTEKIFIPANLLTAKALPIGITR